MLIASRMKHSGMFWRMSGGQGSPHATLPEAVRPLHRCLECAPTTAPNTVRVRLGPDAETPGQTRRGSMVTGSGIPDQYPNADMISCHVAE